MSLYLVSFFSHSFIKEASFLLCQLHRGSVGWKVADTHIRVSIISRWLPWHAEPHRVPQLMYDLLCLFIVLTLCSFCSFSCSEAEDRREDCFFFSEFSDPVIKTQEGEREVATATICTPFLFFSFHKAGWKMAATVECCWDCIREQKKKGQTSDGLLNYSSFLFFRFMFQ